MIIRPWAQFFSDLPEDEIFDEDGEYIQWGGKSAIEAVAEVLTQIGCQVTPPEHAHEHGWDTDFYWQKRRFWLQVTLIDEYLLLVEDPAFLSRGWRKYRQMRADLMTRLAEAMAQDSRFRDIRWFLQDEVFKGPGAEHPVSPGHEKRSRQRG